METVQSEMQCIMLLFLSDVIIVQRKVIIKLWWKCPYRKVYSQGWVKLFYIKWHKGNEIFMVYNIPYVEHLSADQWNRHMAGEPVRLCKILYRTKLRKHVIMRGKRLSVSHSSMAVQNMFNGWYHPCDKNKTIFKTKDMKFINICMILLCYSF